MSRGEMTNLDVLEAKWQEARETMATAAEAWGEEKDSLRKKELLKRLQKACDIERQAFAEYKQGG